MRKLIVMVVAMSLLAMVVVAQDATKTDTTKPAVEMKVLKADSGKAAATKAVEKKAAGTKAAGKEAVTKAKGTEKPTGKLAERWVTTKTGLKYLDEKVGAGEVAAAGNSVQVNYTGWLDDGGKKGKQFDSSVGKQPLTFKINNNEVIKGWDEGVTGMKVGGKRTLIVPSDLGYGAQGYPGAIPPNSTLIFDVELLKVTK